MLETIETICHDNGWPLNGNRIRIELADGRHQIVEFGTYEAGGLKFVRFYSRLGELSSLDPNRLRAALRLNWTLPYGAVAAVSPVEGGEELLVLCDSVLADRVPAAPDRVREAILFLAKTADGYEHFVFHRDEN